MIGPAGGGQALLDGHGGGGTTVGKIIPKFRTVGNTGGSTVTVFAQKRAWDNDIARQSRSSIGAVFEQLLQH